MKYGDISLVLCISTRLRLVTILSLLVKYLVILHADPCNKSYIYNITKDRNVSAVPMDLQRKIANQYVEMTSSWIQDRTVNDQLIIANYTHMVFVQNI